jgi:hypothetical protein
VSRQDSRRPGAGRAVHALGTCCGTLAVAAVVSAVYPVPEPVLRSDGAPVTSRDDVLSALTDVWFPLDESAPVGGPLEAPTIGVGLPEFDDQMEARESAREASPRPPVRTDDVPAPAPERIEERPPGELPGRPPEPPLLPPVVREPQTPAASPPATETPTTPAAPTTPPPAEPTPTTTPPPAEPTPTTPPPGEKPVEEPPPAEEPPPPPPPPDDTTLALGERYDHVDAEGTVLFSITLVRVDTDVACPAPGALPAENGHLIGLHVEVAAPPAADAPPPVSSADFRFLDADAVLTADVDTGSSAACLEDGTVVLDVPAVTGTVLYRPASWPAALRWVLPPADQP